MLFPAEAKRFALLFVTLLAFSSAVLGVEVKGPQVGVWQVSASPYFVVGDVTVPNNMTLTIEPGVIVKFAGKYSLKVNGTLIATGGIGRRIVFTSTNDNEFGGMTQESAILPTRRDWLGIEFAGASGNSSKMEYCIVRFSDLAISAKTASPTLNHFIIADCNVDQLIINGQAIPVENGIEKNYTTTPVATTPLPGTPTAPAGSETKEANRSATEAILPESNLDQLMGNEFSFGEVTVISAAKKAQSIMEAPAAITVITEEDIRQSGAITIPDLMRMVPGMDVMEISAADLVVNARGYNKEMANKMLVLLDGRYVYWDFYGIILWDSFPIVMEEIKRIEVVRGPSSALYGANAFSGVINIITKAPEEAKRLQITGTGGTISTYLGSVIHAGGWSRLKYKVSLGLDRTNQWDTVKEPSRDIQKTNAVVKYNFSEFSDFSLEAGYNQGDGETLTGIGRMDRSQRMKHVRLQFSHPHFFTRIFWAGSEGDVIQLTTQKPYFLNSNTFDIESQFISNLGTKNSFILGGNYRINLAESDLIDKNHRQDLKAIYFQNEYKPMAGLALTLGARYDRHPLVKNQIAPRVNLMLSPLRNHNLRLSYATAYRTPSFIESYLFENTDISRRISPLLPAGLIMVKSRGNSGLNPEKITSYEFGYQVSLWRRVRASADIFFNNLSDFISFQTIGYQDVSPILGYPKGSVIVPATKSYTNGMKSKAIGGEFGVDWQLATWLKWSGAYARQDLTWQEDDPTTKENEKGARVTMSPHRKFSSSMKMTFRNGLNINVMLFYVGKTEKKESWAYGVVDPYTLVNTRIGYQMFKERLELALSVHNLLDKRHYEYPGLDSQGNRYVGYWMGRRITASVFIGL